MKRKFIVFLLAIAAVFFVFTLPISAETTADGFVYTVCDTDSENYVEITGYTGTGGDIAIPSEIAGSPVLYIGQYAFSGCHGITGVTIPESIYYIEDGAFWGCDGMTKLTIGEGVQFMGDDVFMNCTALKTVNWNSRGIYSWYYLRGPFSNAGTAGSGIHVTFGDTVTYVPTNLFYAEDSPKVVSVTFSENMDDIPYGIFRNCEITSVTIPNSVGEVGAMAFYGCPLTSVTFGTGLSYIDESAFAYTSLTSVAFPDNLISISDKAFYNCPELESVTLGTLNTYIFSDAFMNCPKLSGVTIPKSVISIGESAFGYHFDGNDLTKVDFTVSGYTYSAAEQYAKDNGFTFVSLGGAFNDVSVGGWYETYVDDLVVKGIFSGYANHDGTYSFKPENKITRAEFAAILARASGEDLTPYENKTSFSDVTASGWAAAGIEWAYQKEVVNGTGSGKYAPNENISRQDMAVMIARFAENQGIALNSTVAAIVFADQSEISDYALAAVTSLQQAGIINGSTIAGKAYFNPGKGATRAEAAKTISTLLDL